MRGCCAPTIAPAPSPRPTGWARIASAARWSLPAAGLMLAPKCPMCIAAYVAIVTGAGISLPAAANLRIVFIALCAASLLYLASNRIWRYLGRMMSHEAMRAVLF
jgi:hypothetical protein